MTSRAFAIFATFLVSTRSKDLYSVACSETSWILANNKVEANLEIEIPILYSVSLTYHVASSDLTIVETLTLGIQPASIFRNVDIKTPRSKEKSVIKTFELSKKWKPAVEVDKRRDGNDSVQDDLVPVVAPHQIDLLIRHIYISKKHKSSTIWFSFHFHLSCDLISPCFLPFLSAGNQNLPPSIMSVDELVIFSWYWHRVWDYVIASSRKNHFEWWIARIVLILRWCVCMTWTMNQMY